MTWAKTERRQPKQIQGEITPRTIAPPVGISDAIARAPDVFRPTPSSRVPVSPHSTQARGRRIRESARGKDCQVRYVGICSHDPAMTIWSHARWGAQLGEFGKGMATKSLDELGAFACVPCDSAYDQRMGAGSMTREELDLAWLLGHLRSLGILVRDGII